ncbi:MAG: 4Fe-4S dicluster domain-containing protein [Candidatus Xenobia bacterium]
MTYVVTEPCIGVKDHACVDVCPVDCFYEADEMLIINPDECIDCGACVPECPVEAIFPDNEVPDKWTAFTEKNSEPFKSNPPKTAKGRNLWEADREKDGTEAHAYYQKYPSKH